MQQTDFFIILDHFLPFYPPNSPKNQNFEKLKKHLEILSFYMCTINENHIMYGSWDMMCDKCHYFSFWAIFYLYPSNSLKNENFKQIKKRLEIWSFYTSAPKIMIIWYTVPEIWCVTDVIVIFHFGLFFALLPPLHAQKRKFS